MTPENNPKLTQNLPENQDGEMKDTRARIPEAANRIVDEVKANLSTQQRFLLEIIQGGLSDAEIYRRVALALNCTHGAITMLTEAQAIGRNGVELAQLYAGKDAQ